MKALILSRNDYEFNDNKTGDLVKGSNIYYLVSNGSEPLKLSINRFANNEHLLNDITELPAYYNLVLKTVVKKGQLVQEIDGMKFIKEVDLFV